MIDRGIRQGLPIMAANPVVKRRIIR